MVLNVFRKGLKKNNELMKWKIEVSDVFLGGGMTMPGIS